MKEQSWRLLDKAHHAIHAAEVLIREGETECAAGRAYYAMFYTASALLAEDGLGSTKHSGVYALFGEYLQSRAASIRAREFLAHIEKFLLS